MADYFKRLEDIQGEFHYPKNTVHTVIGTQTASTGSWTGNLDLPSLYDGLTIMYYLPYAGSGSATLNLTLSDGTTTGAINCYYSTGRLTTHYGYGCNIIMTYYSAGSIKVNGTATTDDRWIANANYTDGNDTSTIRPYYTHVTTGVNGLARVSLFARTKDGKYTSFTTSGGTGTKTFDTTTEFDLTKIFYYNASSDLGANTVCGNNLVTMCQNLIDMRYSFNGVTDSASTSTLAGNKPVYIVATPTDNGYFKLVSPYYTQTPTSSDTNVYVLVGYEYDSYRMDLHMVNPIYRYDGTNFIPFRDAKTVNGHTVNEDVPSGAKFTDTTYTLGRSNSSVTLTPSSGSVQNSVTLSSLINGLSEGTSPLTANDYMVTQYAGGGTSNTEFYRRKASNIVNSTLVKSALGTDGSTTTQFLNKAGNWSTPTDTKNTAGSTDTSSKIYLIGATSQATNPQTYSDNEVYATSGVLTTKSVQIGGGSASLVYNANTKSVDFTFS